jgi:hypothetical protein
MLTTTASVSSPANDVRTQVRDQVSHARQSLGTSTIASAATMSGDDHRDFVRHYLRFLSLQAVGKFTHALARLASGLDVLGRRTTETQSRLARTEQDVLHLAAALARVDALPAAVAALDARLAHVEADLALAHHAPDATADEFIRAVTRHLRDMAGPAGRGSSIALGPTPAGWLSAVDDLGLETAECSLERLADHTSESVDAITALFTFDTMSLSEVRRALESSRRVLRPTGTLVIVFETRADHTRPVWLTELHPRVSEPGRFAALARECAFERLVEQPLGAAWPTFHIIVAQRA